MMRHKHYDCIVAWAEGKKIEVFSDSTGQWEDLIGVPYWVNNFQFRIKHEPKPDIVKRFYLESNTLCVNRFSEAYTDHDLLNKHSCIKCTFDGETRTLKEVEVL
jgi:hypothetical protein